MSRFAVLGDPVAHSKSPAMHAAAFRALGMDHTYEAIRVSGDELAGYVDRLRSGELAGLNVTLPHKRRILEHVDEIDATARLCGAANTLVRRPSGTIVAHNTDVDALVRLIRFGPSPSRPGGTAIVIGSGGAARAAIVALALGAHFSRVVVRARSFANEALRDELTRDLADRLKGAGAVSSVELAPLEPERSVEHATSCVIQTTSAGMTGADPGDVVANAVDWNALPPETPAIEVVYAPSETAFVRAAEGAGHVAHRGLEMLVAQGAIAFELWHHVPAPYDAMRSALPFVERPSRGILP